MPTKEDLRRKFRDKRNAIPVDQWRAWSALIEGHLLGCPEIGGAKTVLSYIANGREVETRAILLHLIKEGRTIIAPGTDKSLDPISCLHFMHSDDPRLLSRGNITPFEPVTCDAVDVQDIDLFIVPALVWDRAGNRIGQGGGYFDRLLGSARSDAVKIGLGFEAQFVESITTASWDVRMNMIVTERGIIRIPG